MAALVHQGRRGAAQQGYGTKLCMGAGAVGGTLKSRTAWVKVLQPARLVPEDRADPDAAVEGNPQSPDEIGCLQERCRHPVVRLSFDARLGGHAAASGCFRPKKVCGRDTQLRVNMVVVLHLIELGGCR